MEWVRHLVERVGEHLLRLAADGDEVRVQPLLHAARDQGNELLRSVRLQEVRAALPHRLVVALDLRNAYNSILTMMIEAAFG